MKKASNRKIVSVIGIVLLGAILHVSLMRFLGAIYVPPILMYHSVGFEERTLDGYGGKLNVRPGTFARQMEFLATHGYNVIPLEECMDLIRSGSKIPDKTVSITFDDGLENNYLEAYPVLKKYRLPATIFVATNFVGRESFLSWEDINNMDEDIISIGSHTVSHAWLPSLDTEEVLRELTESKNILEKKTGRAVTTLSYPLGGFNEEVKRTAKMAGYKGAVATNPGKESPSNDIYALKRIRISMTSDNLLVFWFEISGFYTFIKEWRDEP